MHDKPSLGRHWIRQLREKAELELECEMDAEETPHVAKELLHELKVYRIELEMQNETLRQTQLALEEARDRYLELFEFAPVGYVSLTPTGMISEINLTGTTLLGMDRKLIVGRRFAHFVLLEDRDRWYLYLLDLIRQPEKKDCELRLLRGDRTSFYARLHGVSRKAADGQVVVRVTLTDISEQMQMAEQLAKRTAELATARDEAQAANHPPDGTAP